MIEVLQTLLPKQVRIQNKKDLDQLTAGLVNKGFMVMHNPGFETAWGTRSTDPKEGPRVIDLHYDMAIKGVFLTSAGYATIPVPFLNPNTAKFRSENQSVC